MGAALKIDAFGGMQPAVDDRLLPDRAAALAQNTYLVQGRLRGMNTPTFVRNLTDAAAVKVFRIPTSYTDSVHILYSTWLEFQNADTDVVRGPVISDTFGRYYWASSSAAPRYNILTRIQAASSSFLLGVPQPTSAPTVNVTGGAGTTESRAYTYTYVTAYGEEGPPATPTVTTGFISGTWNITMTPPVATDTDLTNRNITQIKIYRTVTGSNGVATYFLVTTIPCGVIETGSEHTNTTLDNLADTTRIAVGFAVTGTNIPANTVVNVIAGVSSVTTNNAATATAAGITLTFTPKYADVLASTTVSANNELESTNWSGPPVDLQGMVAMPNGMIAGWRANEVWFCEPYRPHAWPVSYVIAVGFPVVGLGVSGQSLVIATQGFPNWASGIHPSTIKLSQIQTAEPCLARGSVVSAPEGVYYTSPNGLVLVQNGTATVITRKTITKDRWLSLVPTSTLRAVRLGNMYYGWGGARTGIFEETAFDTDGFEQVDYGGSREGLLLDPTDARVALTVLSNTNPAYSVSQDPWTGEVFIVRSGAVYWVDIGASDPTPEPYIWRSKVLQLPEKRNLGVIKAYFTVPDTLPALNAVANTALVQSLVSGQYGLVRVYADETLVWTRELRVSGELMRLPSGFVADFWQVEIEAYVSVYNVQLASTVKDLAKA